jgi:hypothetical protein
MPIFTKDVEIVDGASLILKQGREFSGGSAANGASAGKVRIRLRGGDNNLKILNREEIEVLRFNSQFAILDVGGKDCEGDIRVHDDQDKVRIHIDGKGGHIRIHDSGGELGIHIDGFNSAIKLSTPTYAEEFDIDGSSNPSPAAVMVLTTDGKLTECHKFADTMVAGVLTGRNLWRPGIVLDRQTASDGRWPLAVAGKAMCKVEVILEPIKVGDLLMTSETAGHATKIADGTTPKAGTIIGKALQDLETGSGVIPILVCLR